MDLKRNFSRSMVVAVGTILTLAGCQKSGEGPAASSTKLALSCKTGQDVDGDSLEIQGAKTAQAGKPVHYSLNQPVGCAEDEKVSWQTPAEIKESADLTTQFKKAGHYVITARVENSLQAKVAGEDSGLVVSTKTTVVSSNLALNGPEYGMVYIPSEFSLAIPSGMTVASAQWNFGDGSAAKTGTGAKSHLYTNPGIYNVSVTVVTSLGQTIGISQVINIIDQLDGFECLNQLAISGARQALVGQPVTVTAFLPACVNVRVNGLIWNFGDGSSNPGNASATHTYTAPGTYTISLAISVIGSAVNPLFTITHTVIVTAVPEEEEPVPPNPLACPSAGQTRETVGESYMLEVACGVRGKRNDTFRDRVVQTCRLSNNGGALLWTETARTKELVTEGQCTGQYCELPAEAMTGVDATLANIVSLNGKYYLADGSRLNLYSSQAPEGACSSSQQARTCTNGVLSGSASFKFLLCVNGCEGFGANGTVKTGVVVGEVSVAKVCTYGETGILDLFHQVADKTCNRGTVVTSNTRQGAIKAAGVCPVYSWVPTENFSACTAACGGEQSRVYLCRDGAGVAASPDRCVVAQPVDKRLCDANPDSVKRSDVVTTPEDGASRECPRSQIGVITQTREKTITTAYACVDHSVQQVSQTTTYSAWKEENFCRDFVGYRCSQDSLDNNKAAERYLWMKKCAPTVPMLADFLARFEGVELNSKGQEVRRNGTGLGTEGRVLYPTFMNREGQNSKGAKCEKPWIAPVHRDAPCVVPATVYIAAVCVSSCATPEQQILAQSRANEQLAYVPFVQAWQEKFAFVATMQSKSSMSSKRMQKTAVDQWVTEVVDSTHEILEFRMKSGGHLRLTPNHPLLDGSAFMRNARDFKVGDHVVQLGGVRDEIISITSTDYFGKVYNVFVKSADIHKNIVVINGYLNGSALFQNEGAKSMNTQIFRQSLIRGVFDK